MKHSKPQTNQRKRKKNKHRRIPRIPDFVPGMVAAPDDGRILKIRDFKRSIGIAVCDHADGTIELHSVLTKTSLRLPNEHIGLLVGILTNLRQKSY
jgi:hypothetical protein